jgi:hypothetical protein
MVLPLMRVETPLLGCIGRPTGNLSGGNLNQLHVVLRLVCPCGRAVLLAIMHRSFVVTALYFPPFIGVRPRGQPRWVRIVTWLILPVVICLSQRLSHACLSISNYTVKLRMAH